MVSPPEERLSGPYSGLTCLVVEKKETITEITPDDIARPMMASRDLSQLAVANENVKSENTPRSAAAVAGPCPPSDRSGSSRSRYQPRLRAERPPPRREGPH